MPWCVFCQTVCCLPSVRRSHRKDQTAIYKSTLANCQGWNLYCYLPLCIKKLRLALWCAGTWVLLGAMPPAFLCIHPPSVQLTSVKSLHKWMLSSRHEMVLSLKKNTLHSKHRTTKHMPSVGVLKTGIDGDKKVQKSFFLFALFLYSH